MEPRKIQISGKLTDEDLDNSKLVEAIAEMRANFTPDTQNKVINLALRTTFIVPTIVENSQELVADEDNHVSFQDRAVAKFMLVNKNVRDEESGEVRTVTYFPAFTSTEELKKLKVDKPYKAFAVKFGDIATMTENTPNVEGFVLDPFNKSHNLPFTKPMLESIKQTLQRFRQEKEAAAKAAAENGEGGEPNITASSSDEQ